MKDRVDANCDKKIDGLTVKTFGLANRWSPNRDARKEDQRWMSS